MKEKIIVSSCLLGENCRWHGRKVYPSSFVKRFLSKKEYEVYLVCPETLGGLKVPREPAKRRGNRVWVTCEEKENRNFVTGREITKEFNKGADAVLALAIKHNIKLAILCKYSPSCDVKGITGRLLCKNGIEVINTF